jgi:hypothetical protein
MKEAMGALLGTLAVLLAFTDRGTRSEYFMKQTAHPLTRAKFASTFPKPYTIALVQLICIAVIFIEVAWSFAGYNQTARLDPASIRHLQGQAYFVVLPARWLSEITSDIKVENGSTLTLTENGRELGPAHSLHDHIAKEGAGRFSHWGQDLIFSSSDETDPRTNNREYRISYRVIPGPFWWLATVIAIVFLLLSPKNYSPQRFLLWRTAVISIFSIAFVIALLILATRFEQYVNATIDIEYPGVGSISAPENDALLWATGGVQFLLERWNTELLPGINRPTVAIMFGSILAIFQRVEAIPILFFCILIIMLAFCSFSAGGTRIGRAVSLWTMVCALLPSASLWQTFVASPMPDLPALIFTLFALLLILHGLDGRPNTSRVCLALLSLGVAAAIRGAMLLAGPALIILWLWRNRAHRLTILILAVTSFAAPLVLDNFLQLSYGTSSNSIVLVNGLIRYWGCVGDPTNFQLRSCATQSDYPNTATGLGEGIRDYLMFASGITMTLLRAFIKRVAFDIGLLSEAPFIAALFLCFLYRECTQPMLVGDSKVDMQARSGIREQTRQIFPGLIILCVILLMLMMTEPWASFALLTILCVIAARNRDFLSVACFGLYFCGIATLTLLGATFLYGNNYERYVSTFSFALSLGLMMTLLQYNSECLSIRLKTPKWARSVPSAMPVLVLLTLYLTVWVWPSSWRSTFLDEVKGRKAALKILDDAGTNRSGYFLLVDGGYLPVYTLRDSIPLGRVRSYTGLARSETFKESFIHPNELLP